MSNHPEDSPHSDYHFDASEARQEHSSDPLKHAEAQPAVRRWPAFVEQFAAIIRNKPCTSNAAADYTDERYYLDRAIPGAGSTSTAALSVQTDALPGVAQCLTATNLAELADKTHLLPVGLTVQVFSLYTRSGTKLYIFNQPPADAVVVKITGAAAGGGKYTGRVLSGASSAVAAGTLAMPEGMTVPTVDNAIICDVEEDTETGHRLSIGGYAIGRVAGVSNGLIVVMIRGAMGATNSPTTLGDGTGGAVAADTTSWSKVSNGTPVTAWVQTRTVWDSTGGVLYAYLRSFAFDARGLLLSISGENRIIVDVPTVCQ
jgi:hypothetical protein